MVGGFIGTLKGVRIQLGRVWSGADGVNGVELGR